MKRRKGIDYKLDIAWSQLVKLRAKGKCEYCGKTTGLNSHHIYSRAKKSTRWYPENGVCLCVAHHTFSSTFSAHLTPLEFIEWLIEQRGKENIDDLRIKANQTVKYLKHEKEELLQQLLTEIKQLEQ